MKHLTLLIALLLAAASAADAESPRLNMPIVQTKYTADPAPLLVADTVFLYTSHDESDAEGFKMFDWLLFKSSDMVNWQACGPVASLDCFKWYDGKNGAWAQQVVSRNGKYYMYCPIHGHGIGVLVASSPYGPFVDPIGEPLVWQKEHWEDIDPTVLIDDDGQAYMYWGNPNLYCVRLNDDMISTSGEIIRFPRITDYQEGPWAFKRGDNYYMAFASTCCPEGIGYAMASSPLGPWEYKGHIMDHTPRTRGNHPGIVDFKGKTYLFGQNYDVFRLLEPRHAERRSVSLAEMSFNADGTIPEVPYFLDCSVQQVKPLDPYQTVEAENMAWGFGLETVSRNPWAPDSWNQVVTAVDDGEYILVRGVDFAEGASQFTLSAASHLYGGFVDLYLDSLDSAPIATVEIGHTKDILTEHTVDVDTPSGIHDLYLKFRGRPEQQKNLFNLDWWRFTPKG